MISIMNRLNRMRNAINEIAFAERQGSVRIYDSSIELEFGWIGMNASILPIDTEMVCIQWKLNEMTII